MYRKKLWIFAINPFRNSTRKSFRKALKLSIAHDSYLYTKMINFPLDDDWVFLYNRYHPKHIAYRTAYSIWASSGGNLSGNTQMVKDLFKQIPAKLEQWIAAIIPVYAKASANFLKLFPLGRDPFEHGKIDSKITAIKTLSVSMKDDVALIPAKVMVDEAYAELDDARSDQEGGKMSKKSNSMGLDKARGWIMDIQYADMGFLINKYYLTPKSIQAFFDLQTLRSNIQSYFTHKMHTTETYSITKNTFVVKDELCAKVGKAKNDTDIVTLYLASTLGGTDSTGITIKTHEKLIITASQFNVDLEKHTFLTAVTNNNLEAVKFAVELY